MTTRVRGRQGGIFTSQSYWELMNDPAVPRGASRMSRTAIVRMTHPPSAGTRYDFWNCLLSFQPVLGWSFRINDAALPQFYVTNQFGTTFIHTFSNTISFGDTAPFYALGMVVDFNNASMTGYINGVAAGSTALVGVYNGPVNNNIYCIGRNGVSANNPATGLEVYVLLADDTMAKSPVQMDNAYKNVAVDMQQGRALSEGPNWPFLWDGRDIHRSIGGPNATVWKDALSSVYVPATSYPDVTFRPTRF